MSLLLDNSAQDIGVARPKMWSKAEGNAKTHVQKLDLRPGFGDFERLACG